MVYYRIEEQLVRTDLLTAADAAQAAAFTLREWEEGQSFFEILGEALPPIDMGISKIECYGDFMMGVLSFPEAGVAPGRKPFAFFVRDGRVAFIDEGDTARTFLDRLAATRRWKAPSVGRLLYDMIELLMENDLKYLQEFEMRLTGLEEEAMRGAPASFDRHMLALRKELTELYQYYDQLVDVGQELQEDENDYFTDTEGRYFNLLTDRATRLQNNTQMLREYCAQLRDVRKAQIDRQQNKTMQFLTVVTTIFMPLTLIAGWYGMNFETIPEFHWPHGYLYVIALSLCVGLGSIWLFKRGKMM